MKTILVIDDEQLIRSNIVRLLTYSGFQGIAAEDGLQGIQMAKAYGPDLILCDIAMSGVDGYGVLRTLRQDPETMTIPLIFLSAKADRSDVRQGMNLGADDYLTKPFTTQELIDTIQARLEKQETLTQPYLDQMKRATTVLGNLAHYDALTNLPNRIFLHHHLEATIEQAKETRQPIAVLSVRLGNIESTNSARGNVGVTEAERDRLIQLVAERLTACVSSQGTVARLDELTFGIVMPDVQRDESAEQAQRILDVLSLPIPLSEDFLGMGANGLEANSLDVGDLRANGVRACIGIGLFPEHGRAAGQLLARSERGLQPCRQQGGHSYHFYQPSMKIDDIQQRSLETDLETAIARSELQLHYQPQVSLLTGRIIGMEALLRWHHPRKGIVTPDQFIPLAENTNLILPIGAWVLQTACAQAQLWRSYSPLPLQVGVNLSIQQFRQPNFTKIVLETLEQTKLSPRLLVLELPEACLTSDREYAAATLQELSEAGIGINVDDFGTGFSCLTSLGQLPIDSLKIDRAFVAQLLHSKYHAGLIKAILRLAQSFKLRAIAEGVETQEQLTFLQEHGCYGMQGYLYSHPLPAQEFEQLLANNKLLASDKQLI